LLKENSLGSSQTLLQVASNREAVHRDIDGVLLLFVQLGQFVQLVEAAVDAGANEALGPELVEHGQVLALSLANDGCQQHQLAPFWQRQDLVDHLTDGLRFQRRVMVRAAWCADPRVEQAQVIVDLGDGADGGARVVRCRLLFDRNGRRKPFDGVHVGLFHHRKELSGVGRERFDVAALAFGIERVERQRRLAGAGEAGDDDQLVAWQGEVDVLQVVGASPTNQNLVQNSLAWRAETRKYTAGVIVAAKPRACAERGRAARIAAGSYKRDPPCRTPTASA